MQAQQNEKLSLLVDDELDAVQELSLLKTVKQDLELQAKLRRYALISQAMKTEQCSVASPDFAAKIHQQLKQEPIYFFTTQEKR
jgi:sigma-E factor negative regulatory protein RseA